MVDGLTTGTLIEALKLAAFDPERPFGKGLWGAIRGPEEWRVPVIFVGFGVGIANVLIAVKE